MSRLYHSASSDALGRRCHRAWWYQYVVNIREPRVEWSAIATYVADTKKVDGVYWWRDPTGKGAPVKSRQRSTALGVAMHQKLEWWYTGAAVNWSDLPGQIAQSGLHLLPHPTRLANAPMVERPIGDAAIVGEREEHAPPFGFRVAGVLWAGYRDLVVTPMPEESARLVRPVGPLLVDYKSSADIARYALTPEALAVDLQANLYALATMTEIGQDTIAARWVYFASKQRRHAEARDIVISRGAATEIVMSACERARHLDTLRVELDAQPNTLACGDYGGCPHHHSAGGPCRAEQTFGSLIQARVPKKVETKMPLPPGIQALTAPANGAPPVSTFGQNAAPITEPPPAADPPKTRAPRTPKAAELQPTPVVVAAPAAGATRTQTITGAFGPLSLTGHAADVIDAIAILKGAP